MVNSPSNQQENVRKRMKINKRRKKNAMNRSEKTVKKRVRILTTSKREGSDTILWNEWKWI